MPLYPGSHLAQNLNYGGQAYAFQNESIGAGQSSIAFHIERDGARPNISVEITFSAAPGAFQIDIQSSDSDLITSYVTEASLASGLNAYNVGRVELTNFWAEYIRVSVVQLTNAVSITAEVSA